MKKWALAVGFESKECGAAVQECRKLVIIFPKTKWILDDIIKMEDLMAM